MRMQKKVIALDADDVLFNTNEHAVEVCQRKYHFEPELTLDEIDKWGRKNTRADCVMECYDNAQFYQELTPIPGAHEMVCELIRLGYEVMVVTAIFPQFMSIRIEQLMKYFPEIPPENIVMTYSKDTVVTDVLLDDGSHNIKASKSTYPVLLRKPWNQDLSGCLAVNSYDEFITLLNTIWPVPQKPKWDKTSRIVVLIGPTGSGKRDLIRYAESHQFAHSVKSYTSRAPRQNELDYYFVNKEKFLEMKHHHKFFETTVYAGEYFGTTFQELQDGLKRGNVILATDICGALALKQAFPDRTELIYVERQKEALVRSIIERDTSVEDKTRRICSLEDEYKNKELCDDWIDSNQMDKAYQELTKLFVKESCMLKTNVIVDN